MQEGLILDATEGAYLVSRWIEGKPEVSRWTGAKIKAKEQHQIQSFRCPNVDTLSRMRESDDSIG